MQLQQQARLHRHSRRTLMDQGQRIAVASHLLLGAIPHRRPLEHQPLHPRTGYINPLQAV